MKINLKEKSKISGRHLFRQVTNHMIDDDTENIHDRAYHLGIPVNVTIPYCKYDWENTLRAIHVRIRKSFGFQGESDPETYNQRIGIVTGLDFNQTRYVQTFDSETPLIDPHFHCVILLPKSSTFTDDVEKNLRRELSSLREVEMAQNVKSARRKISIEKISGGRDSLSVTIDYTIKAITKFDNFNFDPPYRIYPYHKNRRIPH